MAALVRALAFAALPALAALIPMLAWAQSPSPPADSTAGPAATTTNVSPDAPAADSAEPAKPAVVPATGYSYGPPTAYGATSTARGDRTHARAPGGQPGNDALMTGFETLADGSTRLFIELSKPVAYETKASGSTFTLILKEVRVDRRNNRNPMVTVHFNTPVTTARLVPHGRNLWLVIDLRANVQPAVTMATTDTAADTASSGGTTLRVGFPKGDYLQLPPGAPATASASAPAPRQQASASADTP
jgi:hypothetical protein